MDEVFQSAQHRFRQVAMVRTSQIPFIVPSSFDPTSAFLEFELGPAAVLHPDVVVEQLYERKQTETHVYKLCHPQLTIVLKAYRIRSAEPVERLASFDIEIRYLRLFAELVSRGISPHFTLPIGRVVLPAIRLQSLLPDLPMIDPGDYHVILSECADESLTQRLRDPRLTGAQLRVLLFQCLYTLAAVQHLFPSFLHNDLHCSNVLVQRVGVSVATGAYTRYRDAEQRSFYHDLHETPYRALLWDMYFGSISTEDEQHAGLTRVSSECLSVHNQYLDVHKLCDSVYSVLYAVHGGRRPLGDTGVFEFLEFAVPDRYQCHRKGLTAKAKTALNLSAVHHTTPAKLLGHAYFEPLRVSGRGRCVQKYSVQDFV